jgi:transcriptional regulator with XRE-family HTH domain
MAVTPIKLLRVSHDLRQADIERRTGIKQGRYSAIERGVQKPNESELERLSEIFGLKDLERWFAWQ